MEWKKEHAFLGAEFDWIAVDDHKQLAYFSTAGFGPLPTAAASIGDQMYQVCDSVETLPEATRIVVVSSRPAHEEWYANARRGFFTYDWNQQKAVYEIIAQPDHPLLLEDLDLRVIREVVEQICVSGNFEKLMELSDQD